MLRRRLLNKKGIDYSGAVVGDILCSDMTTVSRANYLASGKTAIGVVINNSNRKLRVAALNSVTGKYWDSYFGDITTLPNITSVADALSDMDGHSNTLAIWNFTALNQNADNAVGYCHLYTTAGTQAGQWYLPAAGEWSLINTPSLLVVVNSAMNTCGGEAFGYYSYDYYLTSTENSSYIWLAYSYTAFALADILKSDANQYKTRPLLKIDY